MDIEIVVIGESGKWVLSHPYIRIGQDQQCEVSLPPGRYPMVSAEHAALHVVNGAVVLAKGERGGGEIYLNGHPASAGAAVRSGDILRLGSGGPELRIRLLQQEAYAPPVGHEPTRIAHEPTRVVQQPPRPAHEPTRVISSPATASYSYAPGASGRQGYSAEAARGVPAAPHTPPPAPAARGVDSGALRLMEKKLNTLRTLLVANLAILLLLCGWIFVQGRELDENRDEVRQLRAQAQSAVGQLTPALDARLSVFEQRMDGMDAKLAAAQDRMVKSINSAIPAMLDKYIAGKMAELKR